jgi:hypothetical protein
MPTTEEQMAADLIAHIKRTHTPQLAVLEDRIAAVLGYMAQVSTPNMVTLTHIEAYLTGRRDSMIALAVSKIDEISGDGG